MIKHFFIIVAFLFVGMLQAKAQTTDLIYHLGSTSSTVNVASVATDPNGNIYVCGDFTGSNVEFNPLGTTTKKSSGGLSSGFIASYNSSGILKKVVSFGNSLYNKGLKVYVDPVAKNVYLLATASGNVVFSGVFGGSSISSGNEGMALVKYDIALNLVSAKVFKNAAGTNSGDLLTDLAFYGPDLYITGGLINANTEFNPGGTSKLLSSSGISDIIIAKYDTTTLTNIWAYNVGGTDSDGGGGIDLDNSGNIYLTGYFTGQSIDIDPVGTKSVSEAGGGSSTGDVFVAKYNSSMACQWAFNIGASQVDKGTDILVDKTNGNVYVGGYVMKDLLDVYFDPTTTSSANFTGIGSNDIFVASYTSTGAYNWHLATGSANDERLSSLAFDLGRNIVLSGFASGTVNFGNSKTITGLGGKDAFFAVLSSGSGLATAAYNLGGASNEQANGVTVASNGKILVVGSYNGTGDYDIGAANTLALSGSQDGFISRHVLCSPPSIGTQPSSTSSCEGTPASFTVSATGATSYQWENGSGVISGATNATYSIPAVALGQAGSYTVDVTNACQTVTSNSVTLTVNPKPSISSPSTASVCSGTALNYPITSVVASSYSWTRAAVTGITPTTGSGSTTSIAETLINGTTAPVNVTYIITPTSTTGSCVGAAFTLTVTVNPKPSISSASTASVCSGTALNYAITSAVASSYSWTRALKAGITPNTGSGTTSPITEVLNNSTTSSIAVDYIITPTATTGGCVGTAFTFTVTVNPLPVITGTPTVCTGSTTTLTGTGVPDATSPWTSASPGIATVNSSGVVSGSTAGTSVITYKNSNGCITTQMVTVNPAPTITGTLTVCVGLTTQLTGTNTPASSGAWVSTSTSIATVNTSGLVTGVSAGTSVITYKDNVGCTKTAIVTVNPSPAITGTTSVCIGSTTQLTGSGTANATNPWTSAIPTVATVDNGGLVTGVAAGTSTITYTNNNGCTATLLITVNGAPTITGTLTVCVGLTTQLTGSNTPASSNPWVSASPSIATVNSSGLVTGVAGGTSIITYTDNGGCTKTAIVTVNPSPAITGTTSVCIGSTTQLTGSGTANATNPWTSSAGAIATVDNSGLVSGVAAGTSTITYTNNSGCKTTTLITVNSGPTITGTLTVCVGLTTQLTGTNTPASSNPWVSASPSIATISNTGLVTGIASGTSVITYTDNGGCTKTAIVTVNPLPIITGTSSVCVGLTTQLTGSGTANASSPWVSATTGVATVNSSGLVTGVAAGTSVITYTNSNGCKTTTVVTVNPTPAITGITTVCVGLTTQLTGSNTPASSIPWLSASPSIATVNSSGLITGAAAGTSVITYTDNAGCTTTTTVTVNPSPTITGTAIVCAGLTTQLTGSGTANATSPWTSATTSAATVNNSGLVTGVAAGTSIITYKNSNGCVTTQTVTVNAAPTISGTASVCVGLTTQLTGTNTPASSNPWVSASTSIATINNTGLVTAVAVGTSIITYTDNGGCTTTTTITVNPLPTITGTASVCIGSTTQLTGSGTANATTPWISATPSVATVSNAGLVTGVAAGTSIITYKNSTGCVITQTVTVTPSAAAGVTASSSSTVICSGNSITLTAAPANGGTPTYRWKLGSTYIPGASSVNYVTTTAANNDSYSVEMTSSLGCASPSVATSNSVVITVNPTLIPTATISTTSSAICLGDVITFTSAVTNPGTTPSYVWRKNGVAITPAATGTSYSTTSAANGDIYSVAVTSNATCASPASFVSNTITVSVNPLPTITGIPTVCAGSSTTLIGSGTANGSNPWLSATPSVATVTNTGVVTGVSAGTSIITYKNSNGCVTTQVVTVNATPTISGTASACIGLTTQLTGSNTAASSNPWVSASTSIATISNTGLVTGVAVGTSIITYTDNAGCSTTTTITVNSLPTITGTAFVCVNMTTQLTGSGTANATTPWVSATPSVATVSNTGLVTGVAAGTSIITYKNSNGCVMTQTVTVNPTATPGVVIAANNSTICTGANIIFSATPTDEGTTPTYKWKLGSGYISGATNDTYETTAATNGQSYSLEMTSNAACATVTTVTSNAIVISVSTSVIPAVTVTASPSNSICVGGTVTFTANPSNGGSAPTYQWKKGTAIIPGETNATFVSSSLVNGDQISVDMVSNSTCASTFTASSTAITMVVSPIVTATVSITTSANTICDGGSVTYFATYTNGGTTPLFEWFVNSVSQGTPSSADSYTSTTLSDGDVVFVKMTSSITCITNAVVTSNSKTIAVTTNVVPSVSITSDKSTICAAGVVNYTATPVNGGTASYQWKINGTNSGSATASNTFATSSLVDADVVTVVLTSSVACVTSPTATSNGLTITVAPVTQIISQPGNQSVCALGNNVTFSVGAVGDNLTYQWKTGVTNLANNSTYSGVTTKDLIISNVSNADLLGYNVTITGTCGTLTSNVANLTQSTSSISIATQPVAQVLEVGEMIQLSITATGPTLSYQWNKNGVDLVNDSRISGANTASLQISNALISDSDNNYTCLIMSPCAAQLSSNATSVTVTAATSTQDALAKGFMIAPNPSAGHFTLSNNYSPFIVEEIEIVSMEGIVVVSKTIAGTTNLNEEVFAQDLPKGMYLLLIKGEGEQAVLKVIFDK